MTVFNAPRGWALARAIGVLAGASLWFGAISQGDHGFLLIVLVGGIWGLLMSLWWLGQVHEVAIAPELIAVRSWAAVLMRRPRLNEFARAEDVWLVRQRRRAWLLRPSDRTIALSLGQWRPLAEALERAGLRVTDRRATWEREHPGLHWVEGAARYSGLALVVCALPVQFMTPVDGLLLALPGVLVAKAIPWVILRLSAPKPAPASAPPAPTATRAGSSRSPSP